MQRRIHNTEQAHFKESLEQGKRGYFRSISGGASWPAWLKSRRAGIDKARPWQTGVCPWCLWAQGGEGAAPLQTRRNLAAASTLTVLIKPWVGTAQTQLLLWIWHLKSWRVPSAELQVVAQCWDFIHTSVPGDGKGWSSPELVRQLDWMSAVGPFQPKFQLLPHRGQD